MGPVTLIADRSMGAHHRGMVSSITEVTISRRMGGQTAMNRNTTRAVKGLLVVICAAAGMLTINAHRVKAQTDDRSIRKQASVKEVSVQKERAADRFDRKTAARRTPMESTSRRVDRAATPPRLTGLRGTGLSRTASVSNTGSALVPETSAVVEAVSNTTQGQSAGPLCTQPTQNCQQPDTIDALTSNRTGFVTADDFRPQTTGSVTEICWWGAYSKIVSGNVIDCQGENPDTFRVRYFNDAGGFPGAVLASFSQTDATLTVMGPVITGEMVAGLVPEYAFTATHPSVPVVAGQCYWVEISNDTGTCTWSWEVSAQGDDWAMQDGDGVNPPDGYELSEFLLRDMAFCLNIPLSVGAPCGPPDNPACPGTEDCCAEAPPGLPPGCNDELCCERVCACDPLCCDPLVGWDEFCATTGLADTGCGAQLLCPQVCSFCGAATAGDCCSANGTPSCDDTICCNAVCADDPFCCETEWDSVCAGETAALPAECPTCSSACGDPAAGDCCAANETPGCSDAVCCGAVCACDSFCCTVRWDEFCAGPGAGNSGCGAEVLCTDLCGCPNTCGDVNGDGANDMKDFALFANCFGLPPDTSQDCRCSDLNGDGSIDLDDYALFESLFGSSSVNTPPNCP